MRLFSLIALLVVLATTAVWAQGYGYGYGGGNTFPYTSQPLVPGTVVISQPQFGPQQIFVYNGRSLQIITPYVNEVARGGYQIQGPLGVVGRDARGFPIVGGPGFYPPQTTGSFSMYGGPVVTIPTPGSIGGRNSGNMVLTGPGFSPLPIGSVGVFDFHSGQASWAQGRP